MKHYYSLVYDKSLANETKSVMADMPSCASGIEQAVVKFVTRMKNGEFIDAQTIQNALFPSVRKKYFISHSHQEVGLAIRVAGELGIENCFIDSFFWCSADKVLVQLQEDLLDSTKNENTYLNADKLAAHFYGMLSVAIQNAIADASTFIYIPPANSFCRGEKNYQLSPWIYQELSFARNMYNQANKLIKEATAIRNFSTGFAYCSDLSFLKPVSFKNIRSI